MNLKVYLEHGIVEVVVHGDPKTWRRMKRFLHSKKRSEIIAEGNAKLVLTRNILENGSDSIPSSKRNRKYTKRIKCALE